MENQAMLGGSASDGTGQIENKPRTWCVPCAACSICSVACAALVYYSYTSWHRSQGLGCHGADSRWECSHQNWVGYYADRVWASNKGYKEAYCSKSSDNCETIEDFPGRNIQQFASWANVAEDLKTLPSRLESGQAVKLNELGWQRLNPVLWKDDLPITGYSSIILALNLTDQRFARPVMENIFSTGGTKDTVRREIREFATRCKDNKGADSNAVYAFAQKLLHKVTLCMDISDADADELVQTQSNSLMFLPWVPNVLAPMEKFLGMRKTRKKWIHRYEANIKNGCANFPDNISDRQVRLLAAACFDTMMFAGGFSISQGLWTLLALMYQESSPIPEALNEDTSLQVVWEALRLYPLVGAIPYWDLNKKKHVWPNLFLAMWDEKEWGDDAMEYKLRPLSLYQKKGDVAFGAPAVGRGCPAQKLAVEILSEFLQLWPKGEYETSDKIVFTNSGTFYPASFKGIAYKGGGRKLRAGVDTPLFQ